MQKFDEMVIPLPLLGSPDVAQARLARVGGWQCVDTTLAAYRARGMGIPREQPVPRHTQRQGRAQPC